MEEFIVKVLSGEASELEQRKLERWRGASPENERAFQEFAHTWNLTSPKDWPEKLPPAPKPDRIIAMADSAVDGRQPLHGRPSMRWGLWAAAAAVLLATSAGVYRVRSRQVVFATGAGQTITVPLTDGSVVRLGSNSTLRVRNAAQRSVDFDGTAFFAVATDSAHPFVVRTRTGEAEVLGTRFELRADRDSIRLVVVEGRVRLAAAGERVEVPKGHVSRVVRGAVASPPEPTDVWDLIRWPRGILMFQATPLEQVMEEIGAHFDVPFTMRDTVLARRTVTAWFGDEPLEDVVSTVCQVVGARCTPGDTVEVGR